MRSRRAFTLIELLVVVAVLLVLAALTLVAVQAVRQRARQSQCQANLHHLGVAIHAYHEARGSLPLGRVTRFHSVSDFFTQFPVLGFLPGMASPETPWALQLLPYLNQPELADRFNDRAGVIGYIDRQTPFFLSGPNANHELAAVRMPAFECPLDRHESFTFRPWILETLMTEGQVEPITVVRSNYAACWGNTNWDQDADLDGDGKEVPGVRYLPSAFGTRGVRFHDIRDGLTSTVLLSEVLTGPGTDIRGILWSPAPGATIFMTRLTPNGTVDTLRPDSELPGDAIPLCNDESPRHPCHSVFDLRRLKTTYAGARSFHSGGVHALMGDGSVRFVADGIDPSVWIAMGSIAGGENAP